MANFAAAARSILRGRSLRATASRLASQPKCKPKLSSPPSTSRASSPKNLISQSFLKRSVESSSFALEAMMPYHSATASALMTSMLSLSHCGYGRQPDGI